jgi:hypothetical protein
MRRLATIAFATVIFLLPIFSFAQNKTDVKIDSIRSRVAAINSGLVSFKKIKKDDMGQTTEGGIVIGYFSGHQIKKISTIYYGETGKVSKEYYFYNKELIFYYSFEKHYQNPIYAAHGKNIISDKRYVRYYFNNNRLIKYLLSPPPKHPYFLVTKTAVDVQTETKRLLALVQ